MTAPIPEQLKDLTRLAIKSHENCAHDGNVQLCILLICAEVSFRRGEPLTEEEMLQVSTCVADQILENLVLKGMVEPQYLDDKGEFIFGLTEAGEEALSRKEDENGTD